MKRMVWLVVLLSLIGGAATLAPPSGAAGGPCPGVNRPVTPYASEYLTVDNTARSWTVATYTAGGAVPVMAQIQVQHNPVMATDDGSTPTTSVGQVYHAGSSFTLCGQSVGRFKAVRHGSANGKLHGLFYR